MVKYFRAFVGRFSKQGRRYVISFRLIACVVQTCLTRPQGPLQNHINMLNNYEHWTLITRAVAVPQPTQSMLRVTQSQRGFLFSGPDAILNGGPSGRIATNDVIQISTTRAVSCCFLIKKHSILQCNSSEIFRNVKDFVIPKNVVFPDIDECQEQSDNCHAEWAMCTNTNGSFSCACQTGFRGDGVTCDGELFSSFRKNIQFCNVTQVKFCEK